MDYYGYSKEDFIPSFISGKKAVDIHHIVYRSRACNKYKDHISNLIPLTREEHDKAHNEEISVQELLDIVYLHLKPEDCLTEKQIRYG